MTDPDHQVFERLQLGFVAAVDVGDHHGRAVESKGCRAVGKPRRHEIEADLRARAESRANRILEHRVGGDDDDLRLHCRICDAAAAHHCAVVIAAGVPAAAFCVAAPDAGSAGAAACD